MEESGRRQHIKPTCYKNAPLKHGDTAGAAFPSEMDWSIPSAVVDVLTCPIPAEAVQMGA